MSSAMTSEAQPKSFKSYGLHTVDMLNSLVTVEAGTAFESKLTEVIGYYRSNQIVIACTGWELWHMLTQSQDAWQREFLMHQCIMREQDTMSRPIAPQLHARDHVMASIIENLELFKEQLQATKNLSPDAGKDQMVSTLISALVESGIHQEDYYPWSTGRKRFNAAQAERVDHLYSVSEAFWDFKERMARDRESSMPSEGSSGEQ